MEKSADQVLAEKRMERGWDQEDEITRTRETEPIKALPLTNEEYQIFQSILRKLALYEQKPELADLYFELERRATYGNKYPQIEGTEEMEQELWNMGTNAPREDTAHRNL